MPKRLLKWNGATVCHALQTAQTPCTKSCWIVGRLMHKRDRHLSTFIQCFQTSLSQQNLVIETCNKRGKVFIGLQLKQCVYTIQKVNCLLQHQDLSKWFQLLPFSAWLTAMKKTILKMTKYFHPYILNMQFSTWSNCQTSRS